MGSEEFGVWPDNWVSFGVFVSMGTQWRTGAAGPTGLDYGVLSDVMRLGGVPETEWPEVFGNIRLMEGEALKQMLKKD